ncbi:MAG: hypothetical protein FIB08_04630 [Candidatus Methanoperedens sp.]|nr:hypothetical protein [Candidatus Methanoperedens sp.]
MSSANNILKILVGIVILAIGVVWYTGIPGVFGGFLRELLILIEASVGLFLLFVGLIIAWMGYDDYKMDIEMAKEEKKEEKK